MGFRVSGLGLRFRVLGFQVLPCPGSRLTFLRGGRERGPITKQPLEGEGRTEISFQIMARHQQRSEGNVVGKEVTHAAAWDFTDEEKDSLESKLWVWPVQ